MRLAAWVSKRNLECTHPGLLAKISRSYPVPYGAGHDSSPRAGVRKPVEEIPPLRLKLADLPRKPHALLAVHIGGIDLLAREVQARRVALDVREIEEVLPVPGFRGHELACLFQSPEDECIGCLFVAASILDFDHSAEAPAQV